MIPKDFRGQELVDGTVVAYNLSGEIAIGKIVSWKLVPRPEHYPSYLWGEPRFSFKVEVIAARTQKPGHISTVTVQHNLLALNELPAAWSTVSTK